MNKSILINNTIIASKSNAYIVAEIGLNHNKDLELTKKMILAAKKSGADAVKFQTYITEKLINQNSPAYNIFKNLELSKEDFFKISSYCRDAGITFFSTPFCYECVDWLEELNVPCYKIASMDTNYYDFLKYIASTKKPVILSTGLSPLSIIDKAVNTILKEGNDNIIILHTISKYPPQYEDMDMRMIERLKTIYDGIIGFSDHTKDNTMAIVARTLGACLFEKHFTLDKNLEGPDHSISSTPVDFIDLKNKLAAVDKSLIFNTNRKDLIIEKGARRSLYASKDFKKGCIITKEMIDVIRPGEGYTPEDINIFLDRKLNKDMKKGDAFDLSCI